MFYKTHIRPLHMAKFRPLSEEGGKMLTNHWKNIQNDVRSY
jgi:hypothetical protein